MALSQPPPRLILLSLAISSLLTFGYTNRLAAQQPITGLVQLASEPSVFPPRFELVDDQQKHWTLVLSRPALVNSLLNVEGKYIVAHPVSDGVDRAEAAANEFLVAGFEIVRTYTADQRAAAANLARAKKEEFRKSRQPLTDSEAATLKILGNDHPDVLDATGQPRYPLVLTVFYRGTNYWQIDPDGTFKKYRQAWSADSGGVMRQLVSERGKLSPRQMLDLVTLMVDTDMLQLPANIDGTKVSTNLGPGPKVPAYSLRFGDFRSTGTLALPGFQSKMADDVWSNQQKLSRISLSVIFHVNRSVRNK